MSRNTPATHQQQPGVRLSASRTRPSQSQEQHQPREYTPARHAKQVWPNPRGQVRGATPTRSLCENRHKNDWQESASVPQADAFRRTWRTGRKLGSGSRRQGDIAVALFRQPAGSRGCFTHQHCRARRRRSLCVVWKLSLPRLPERKCCWSFWPAWPSHWIRLSQSQRTA